jgi:plastocyanin
VPADVFTPGLVFSPFSITIVAGGSVRFHITGDDHNVIFNPTVPGAPPDINVVKDQTVSRTFNTRGTFPYDCTVHPGMSGEIVVR